MAVLNKACLVILGNTEVKSLDYHETYTPIAKTIIICTFFFFFIVVASQN